MRCFSLAAIVILPLLFLSTGHARPRPRTSSTPISLSLIPPVQFPSSKFQVSGIRAGVVNQNRVMKGIDIGLIGSRTDQDFTGLAVSGIYNYTKGNTNIVGLQLAGIANINKGNSAVYGIQASLGANISKYTDIYGVQIGLYNRARVVTGLQIGLVNHATNLRGIQIGLANFNDEGPYTVSPVINFGF